MSEQQVVEFVLLSVVGTLLALVVWLIVTRLLAGCKSECVDRSGRHIVAGVLVEEGFGS